MTMLYFIQVSKQLSHTTLNRPNIISIYMKFFTINVSYLNLSIKLFLGRALKPPLIQKLSLNLQRYPILTLKFSPYIFTFMLFFFFSLQLTHDVSQSESVSLSFLNFTAPFWTQCNNCMGHIFPCLLICAPTIAYNVAVSLLHCLLFSKYSIFCC